MTTPDDLAGSARLRAYLEDAPFESEIVEPGVPMPTVPLAAEAIGVRNEQIVKSVLFIAPEGHGVLAIACGTARIDRHALSAVAGMQRLKLASAEQVLAVTGYPAGGVAPVGHRTDLPVVIDSRVMDQPVVYGGAGSEDALLRITPADIVTATSAVIADITQAGPAS